MKTMFNLTELAKRIETDEAAKADFVVPGRALMMRDDLQVGAAAAAVGLPYMPANDLGHAQVCDYTPIPKPYYDLLRQGARKDEHENSVVGRHRLLAENVNQWLREKPAMERRMVRTLGGNVRALLSDAYRRIENADVADRVLNLLAGMGSALRIVSCAVTEQRMYIKAVRHDIAAPDPGKGRVGDLVEAGIAIGNSEVGLGSLYVEPFAHFLWCTNGMVRKGEGLRMAHVGRKIDAQIEGALSRKTKLIEDAATMSRLGDIVKHAFNEVAFRDFMRKLTETTQQPITGDVNGAVEALGSATSLGLNIGERQSVLRHLIEGGDLSRYGLVNAVTRTAEDVQSYDRATEIEALGYELANMPATTWGRIAQAKPLQLVERVGA